MVVDTDSITWMVIAKHLEEREQNALARLRKTGCDPRAADEMRGRLAEIDELRRLAYPNALPAQTSVRYTTPGKRV